MTFIMRLVQHPAAGSCTLFQHSLVVAKNGICSVAALSLASVPSRVQIRLRLIRACLQVAKPDHPVNPDRGQLTPKDAAESMLPIGVGKDGAETKPVTGQTKRG